MISLLTLLQSHFHWLQTYIIISLDFKILKMESQHGFCHQDSTYSLQWHSFDGRVCFWKYCHDNDLVDNLMCYLLLLFSVAFITCHPVMILFSFYFFCSNDCTCIILAPPLICPCKGGWGELVRDSSAVRSPRLFVRLAGVVVRQSPLHKENSGFSASTLVGKFPRFVAIGFYFLSETLI